MCGFVAVINSLESSSKLKNSFLKLKKINNHRGPDDVKIVHKKNYSLLFRRLEIIDLHKRSAQPFTDETGKIHLLFNGEVYNYVELKNELKKLNVQFKTKSDTEVIMQSYKYWGINFIRKLRGMFSIIILDNYKNRFLCFRDRLGQKPLYYSKYKNGLVLSSEIKDIIHFKKKNQINENKKKIIKYLNVGQDSGNETFFTNIFSFPPSSIGIIKKGSIIVKKYWKLDINKNKKFYEDEFEDVFANNIKIHLRSDVPIAFTLSGGFDSSMVVKESLNHLQKYNTYSLYSDSEKKLYEKKYILEFVKNNSLNHDFFNIDMSKKDLIEKYVRCVDEPSISSSFLPQLLLREKIKKDSFKVLITGEGGDESLAGYNRMMFPYIYILYLKNNKKIPKKIKDNLILNQSFNVFQRDFLNFKRKLYDNYLEDKSAQKFLNIKNNYKSFYNLNNLRKKNGFKSLLKNHIFNSDLPYILKTEDRISMSQSIENRTPLVDHVLLEYIFSINEKYFILNGESKYMLRKIAKNKIPNSYFKKEKIGRPSPINKYMFEDYYEKFCDLLLSGQNKNDYFSNELIFKEFIKDRKNNNFINIEFYFKILNLFVWRDEFNI